MGTCRDVADKAARLFNRYNRILSELDSTPHDGHLTKSDINDPGVNQRMLAHAASQFKLVKDGIVRSSANNFPGCVDLFGDVLTFGSAATFLKAVDDLEYALNNLWVTNAIPRTTSAFPIIPLVNCGKTGNHNPTFDGADYDEEIMEEESLTDKSNDEFDPSEPSVEEDDESVCDNEQDVADPVESTSDGDPDELSDLSPDESADEAFESLEDEHIDEDIDNEYHESDAPEFEEEPHVHHCDPNGDGIITENFVDPIFLSAIKTAMGVEPGSDITVQDALNTTSIDLAWSEISDISGIECFSNLTELMLYSNQISDLSPLSELYNLQLLAIWNNRISDLSALSGLTNLSHLLISQNQISDISPLRGLTNMRQLWLNSNQISDLSPLSEMNVLYELEAEDNLISELLPLFGLVSLQKLWLSFNEISDVLYLSSLTNLYDLALHENQISDITPLISNEGLGTGDFVGLSANPNIPPSQVEDLRNKGVTVYW